LIDPAALASADILPFLLIGFAAQLVDGALGMAFGVISSTLLISAGVPPAAASASVHIVESFTTGISGISHSLMRNVNWRMLARLAIPGVIGGVLGAYVLANTLPDVARPLVLGYLSLIGLWLLWRGIRHKPVERKPRVVEPLGFAGGFLDAAGGGGWGPVVTSNLLIQGASPRTTIGTVNTAEFFLAVSISITFLLTIGWEDFTRATLGLLLGGILAAPLGALLAKRIAAHHLMVMVGVVLTLTSAYGIWTSLA
jgi:uncharacterized membrane protein YfcA